MLLSTKTATTVQGNLVFSPLSVPYIFSLWYISYTKHTVKSQEAAIIDYYPSQF